MAFSVGVLYALARVFHRQGWLVPAGVAGEILSTGLALGMGSQVPYWLTNVVVFLGLSILKFHNKVSS